MPPEPLPVIAGQLDVDDVLELVGADDASPLAPAPALVALATRATYARQALSA